MLNFKPWEQPDWSIVDIYWNIISMEKRIEIMDNVAALPVTQYLDEIRHQVKNNSIIIVKAPTWSWKTTQIPKALSKLWNIVTTQVNTIATQPRRVSAVSIADRVSCELMADTWDSSYSLWMRVWYRTGECVSSKHTSEISFHTDWLELMRWWVSGIRPKISILDELHGFTVPLEMLCMHLRNLLLKTKTDIRVVLMSATLDSFILQDYFRKVSSDIPVIEIPGRTFEVEKYFNPEENYISTVTTLNSKWEDVLLFQPWKKEILSTIAELRKNVWSNTIIHPLYSELPIEEQTRVLKKEDNTRVIIVATDIAEESLTIPYLNTVVDTWIAKTVFVNKYWIEELRVINISKANSLQRAWRVWRTKLGKYIRTNSTPFEDLSDYPITAIEKEMIGRYILICLVDGIDMNQNLETMFIHKPSRHLFNLTYSRLKKIWAINQSGKITELWVNLLKFPLSIDNSNNAMILQESLDRWCSADMIWIVAILEKKWFLSKTAAWKSIKMHLKKEWDLFAYLDLFRLITAKELPKWKIELFAKIWMDTEEIKLFQALKWQKMFFEVVNLESLWIKTKKVYEIYNLIENLKDRFERLWYTLEKTWDLDDKKLCLLSGNMHNVFKYNAKSKTFKNMDWKMPIEFKAWNVSLVDLEEGGLYIWQPFIIWWVDGKDDFNLLTNLTRIDQGHLSEFNEARVWKEDSWELFGHSNPKAKKANIKKSDIALLSFDNEDDFAWAIATMWDKTKAKHYIAKNRLPHFLISHNTYITKFIKWKWKDFNLSVFTQLLRKITVLEEHRIDTNNLAKTQLSFRNDTTILDMFLNSEDPAIKWFLAWEKIDLEKGSKSKSHKVSKKDKEEIAGANESEINETHEFKEFKEKYELLLKSIKPNKLLTNLKELKQNHLSDIFEKIGENKFYSDMILSYYELIKVYLTREQIITHITELKAVSRKKSTLKKVRNNNENLKKFILNVKECILKNCNVNSLNISEFILDDEDIKKFISWLELVRSGDKRKKNRWYRMLQTPILKLQNKVVQNNTRAHKLQLEINFDKHLTLKKLSSSVTNFLSSLFEQKYFESMILQRVNFIVTKILTNHLDWNINFDFILTDFILSKDFSKLNFWNEIFRLLDRLKDLDYEIETHKSHVLDWVKESKDLKYIQSMIHNLGRLKNEKSNLIHKIKALTSIKEEQKHLLKDLRQVEKGKILAKKLPIIDQIEREYDILDLKVVKEKREEIKKIPKHKSKNNNSTFQELKKERERKRIEDNKKKEEKRQENLRKKADEKARKEEKKRLDDEKKKQFLKEELPEIKAKEAKTIAEKRALKKAWKTKK